MRVQKYLLVCFFLIGIFLPVLAQHSELTKKNSKKNNFSTVKFRKNKKMAIICPIFHLSEFPYQGIGVKFGDPLAISYKFYATEHLAFGIDVGKAASALYSNLLREEFNGIPNTDSTVLIYEAHDILNHIVFSGRVFYYIEGPKALKGLDAYIGAGWQVQFIDLEYAYLEVDRDPPNLARTRPPIKASYQPMGPDVTLGIEYAYFSLPVSAFLEGTYFFDLQLGWRRFQGGIGLRYVF